MTNVKSKFSSPTLHNYIKEKQIDAIELTVLLKIFGLRLESINFDRPLQNRGAGIEVSITCKNSGLVSKLLFDGDVCNCPVGEMIENNSFWVVHGKAPCTHSKENFTDTSSNLLPVINADVTQSIKLGFRKILNQLHDSIKTAVPNASDSGGSVNGDRSASVGAASILLANQALTSMNDFLKIGNNTDLIEESIDLNNTFEMEHNVISPAIQLPVINENFSTPLSSINVTPTEPCHFVGTNAGQPKIILQSSNALDHSTPTAIAKNISIATSNEMINSTNEVFASPNSDVFKISPCEQDFKKDIFTESNVDVLQTIKDALQVQVAAHKKLNEALTLVEKSVNTPTSTPTASKANPKNDPKLPQRRYSASGLLIDVDKTTLRKSLSNVYTPRASIGLKNATIQPRIAAAVKAQAQTKLAASSIQPSKIQSRYAYTPRPSPAPVAKPKNALNSTSSKSKRMPAGGSSTLTVESKLKRMSSVSGSTLALNIAYKSTLTKTTSKSMTNLPISTRK